tara:strand:- start:2608 stop:2835 length:228 start_codon:yes stop_codon:yes gene_type:complete
MELDELDFEVKPKNLSEFIDILVDFDIDNEIIGQTEDENPIIHIEYDEDGEEAVGQLLEIGKIIEVDSDEDEDED